tara:strand:- start:140 stop:250 length:111 start_codon:yes stop_codon:yes gene_type:complete
MKENKMKNTAIIISKYKVINKKIFWLTSRQKHFVEN